ncbi:Hypothetical protein NTJ_15573 [Nesidiocoris tenuis]|uniref:Uncharacterized protein n=1 Tax=Nesidiocoris tenuis TaxID=355587 RepID=A0ABN7BFV6_9HEMI|nr:Hypothetical protein NTJ_15573 [Nesidiocoris tenuis]
MKFFAAAILGTLCLVGVCSGFGCFGKPWKRNSIKAKYGILPINANFPLPKGLNDDKIDEYVQVEEDLGIPAKLWCHPNDARVCLIIDNAGNNVGLQISFLDQDTKNVTGFDYTAVNTYVRTNIFDQPANSFRVFYTDPTKLTEEGRAPSDDVIDGVFAYIKGELVQLPLEDPKVKQSGPFYRQACFPQMGQHYFYGMSESEADCTQHVPFFGIYHNSGLVGWGLANYGRASSAKNGRDWYETVPGLGAKLIMPDRPKCVDDLIEKNGLYSMHVYFVENPTLISCLFQ